MAWFVDNVDVWIMVRVTQNHNPNPGRTVLRTDGVLLLKYDIINKLINSNPQNVIEIP